MEGGCDGSGDGRCDGCGDGRCDGVCDGSGGEFLGSLSMLTVM